MPIAVTEDHESLRGHRAALGPDALPAHRAAAGRRGAAGISGPARGLGEDGRPGLARPPSSARSRAGRASRWPSWPWCWRSWVTPCSPGRCCPTVLVSAALARVPHGPADVPPDWLRGLADGSITAAVALGAAPHPGDRAEDGALSLGGTVRPVLGLPTARLVLVPLDDGTRHRAGSCSTGRRSATPSPSRRSRRSTPPGPWGSSPSAATARSRCRGASRSWCPTTTCAAWP